MAQTEAAPRERPVEHGAEAHSTSFWALTLGSIGVVYGDIGTSPLYAFREAVVAAGGTADGSRGRLFSALILVVTLKYVLILLRADNKGEGGTLAWRWAPR
jgi:KUP system potassium uptake protein